VAGMTYSHEDLLAQLRPLMFAIAYRMLGSVSEAEAEAIRGHCSRGVSSRVDGLSALGRARS